MKLTIISLLIGIIPLMGVFAWYNYATAGSITKVAQFIGQSDAFSTTQAIPKTALNQPVVSREVELPFNTRIEIDGIYTLLFSNERAWIYYSPIVLIGCFGLFLAYRRKNKNTLVLLVLSVVLVDIILYSMFGDPWGGWAFGPRYLIPAAALLCSGIGIAIEKWKKNWLFVLLFFILLFYSLTINAAGALTTSAIPPKAEAINLSTPIPYTYIYNFQFIEKDESSSLLYNLYFIKYIDLSHFLIYLVEGASIISLSLYALMLYQTRKEEV